MSSSVFGRALTLAWLAWLSLGLAVATAHTVDWRGVAFWLGVGSCVTFVVACVRELVRAGVL